MKNCISCQADIEDSAKFCPFCGAIQTLTVAPSSLGVAAASSEPPVSSISPAQGNPFAAPAVSAPPASEVSYPAKVNPQKIQGFNRIFTSRLFLAGCILFTLATFGNFVVQLVNDVTYGGSAISVVVGVVVSMILPILIAVGLWLCYLKAKKSVSAKSGLGFLHGVSIAYCVFFWIAIAGLALLAILAIGSESLFRDLAGMSSGSNQIANWIAEGTFLLVGTMLLIIVAVAIPIGVFFFKFLLGYLKSSIESLSVERPIVRAKGLSVFLFIWSALLLIGSVITMADLQFSSAIPGMTVLGSTYLSVLSGLFGIVNAITMILIGVCIRRSAELNGLPAPERQA